MFHVMIRQINAPLLAIAAAAYLAAFAFTRWLARRPGTLERINSSPAAWRRALVILALAYFAVYSYLSVERYYKIMLGAWDAGIFDSLFFNALHGKLFTDYRGPFDHFQPLYLVLVPAYALWKDVRTILVLQTLIFTIPVWPLYLLTRQVTGSGVFAAALGILYLLYPPIGEANLFDIHMLSLSPFFFFFMLYFMVRRQWRWYWAFVILTLCVKESECIIVFGAGLYLLSRKDYLRGALTAAIAVVWFFGVTLVVLPLITGAEFRHFGRFTGLTPILTWARETYLGQLTAAAYLVRVCAICIFMLVPVSFLFARRWRTFVLVFGPAFAINMVSKSLYQNILFGHYAITVSSAAIGASALAAEGLGVTRPDGKPSRLPVFLVTAAALLSLVISYPANERPMYPKAHVQIEKCGTILSLPIPYNRQRLDFYRMTPHDKLFFAMLDAFPPGSVITGQNNTTVYFINRYKVVDFHREVVADYYLFDIKDTYNAVGHEDWDAFYRRMMADPTHVRFIDLNSPDSRDFIFFSRRDNWMPVYNNLRRKLDANPRDEGAALAVAAIEKTMKAPVPSAAPAAPEIAAPVDE